VVFIGLEKLRALSTPLKSNGTIGVYVWYYLHNDSKGVAYIQVLSKWYSKSSVCLCSDLNN
jgi:phage gp16-like protein